MAMKEKEKKESLNNLSKEELKDFLNQLEKRIKALRKTEAGRKKLKAAGFNA